MSVREVVLYTYDTYLGEVYYPNSDDKFNARNAEREERDLRIANFPHSVLLQVAYAELDFADRWCWLQFGPAQGECQQISSDYPACHIQGSHTHEGVWTSYWLAKTDYNFGFNEWYFTHETDKEAFLCFLPHLCWGEKYPE